MTIPPKLSGCIYYLHPQAHLQYFYIMIYYVMTRTLYLRGGGVYNVLGGGINGKDPGVVIRVFHLGDCFSQESYKPFECGPR